MGKLKDEWGSEVKLCEGLVRGGGMSQILKGVVVVQSGLWMLGSLLRFPPPLKQVLI